MANSSTKFVPAPNKYDGDAKSAVMRKSASYGFGTSKRPQSHNAKRQVPGPGHYPARNLIGTESQGKSLAIRLAPGRTTNEFNPGPGTYNSNYQSAAKSAPRYGIGTGRR